MEIRIKLKRDSVVRMEVGEEGSVLVLQTGEDVAMLEAIAVEVEKAKRELMMQSETRMITVRPEENINEIIEKLAEEKGGEIPSIRQLADRANITYYKANKALKEWKARNSIIDDSRSSESPYEIAKVILENTGNLISVRKLAEIAGTTNYQAWKALNELQGRKK